ncbi:MAG: serine--tRNA ligase, partial [Nitrospinaceae bacterium]|nr:serine--tRNA ligase [Nitrospinaceae bacterium]NIR57931.1 serine--tRNA ligase [Nitrospinaceae bacterium]NIS88391.1 serine--tRNA ligase [Nitrospinaceae bacterium]NIT85267.1 serine--tRNA ligase [Nitrospinaceae bacterium]NIU47422.1 serine--tRNA ligase [Nitrospinaceae bacterium]
MLDIKILRENLDDIRKRLERRGPGSADGLDRLLGPDETRRKALRESEQLKNRRKQLSAEVGKRKQQGQD